MWIDQSYAAVRDEKYISQLGEVERAKAGGAQQSTVGAFSFGRILEKEAEA